MAPSPITLAGSDVVIHPLGVGTWAWGDTSTWGMGGYDHDLSEATIREAWDASLEAGVTFFDTAEVYGDGESERIIGRLLAEDAGRDRPPVAIATKFFPAPWKLNVRTALLGSLRASVDRLGVPSVQLYQIHGPISLRSHSALADALAAGHEAGLLEAIGVSNYSIKEMRSMDAQLRRRGLRLATNQIEFSLLRRAPETSGLIAALPLGATLLLVNLSLAVAARSAPQLNLFSVGFPLMLLVGLAALPLAYPALTESLAAALAQMQAEAARVLLGDQPLDDVRWISENELQAMLMSSLPSGYYVLTVENDDGSRSAYGRLVSVGQQIFVPVVLRN